MNNLDSVFEDALPPDHRSGVVAVVGRPNVGKSTLINRILQQKIAIVSPKPQTTRRQQLGIYTQPDVQILFVDTPGLHKPQHKLGEFMVRVAEDALQDADLILWVLDLAEIPQDADRYIAESITRARGETPVVLALNKADLVSTADRVLRMAAYSALVPNVNAAVISAATGEGVEALVADLHQRLPLGPRYYPADQVSEVNLRFIASETIREKIIHHTDQEIPYSVAVDIEEYKERSESLSYISAIIYVERDSQKGIIIGKNGAMLKKIGSEARTDLAGILDTSIYLDLHVKVLKNWRSDEDLMRRLGYRIPKHED
jgi:GTP-binding protein Era